jgi:hypothetical protein
MAAKIKYYRCQNRAKCELAKNRQTVEIIEGKRFVCPSSEPNCERTFLRAIDPPRSGIPKPVLVGAGALVGVVLIGALLWVLLSGNEPKLTGPQAVEAALTEVWPWLRANSQ